MEHIFCAHQNHFDHWHHHRHITTKRKTFDIQIIFLPNWPTVVESQSPSKHANRSKGSLSLSSLLASFTGSEATHFPGKRGVTNGEIIPRTAQAAGRRTPTNQNREKRRRAKILTNLIARSVSRRSGLYRLLRWLSSGLPQCPKTPEKSH